MADEIVKQFKSLPYKIMVQYEQTLRNPKDTWAFRSVTNVLRQNSLQIENYRKRYASPDKQ